MVTKRGKVKKPMKDEKNDGDQGTKDIITDSFHTLQDIIRGQIHAPVYPDEIIRDEKVKQTRRENKEANTNDENMIAKMWIRFTVLAHQKNLLLVVMSWGTRVLLPNGLTNAESSGVDRWWAQKWRRVQ
jgi:hypothetical protein